MRALREALAAAGDLETACETAVDFLVAAGFPLPSIYLRRGRRLRCYASRGYWQIVDGFPPTAGVMGRVYLHSEPALISDTTRDPDFIGAVPGIRGQASMPVICEGETIGVLNVETKDALPEDSLRPLTRVSAALGERIAQIGGLRQETLAEQTSDAVTELSALTEPDAIGRATVAAAARLSGLESALLLRGLGDAPFVQASTGPARLVAHLSVDGLGSLTDLVRSGTSSYVAGNGAVAPGHQFLLDAGVQSLIVLPLTGQGMLDGLLLLSDRRAITPASSEVRLLEQVALQAATSLRTVEALEAVHEQVHLLEVVNGVLAMFASLPAQDFNMGVDFALTEIGRFANVDRSYLFRLHDDGMTMDNTNEWCAPGIEAHIDRFQGVPTSWYGHLVASLRDGNPVHIPSVADMPADEAGVRQRLVDSGILSLLAVPLREGERLVGVLGFDAVRSERTWSPPALQLLRSIAGVLVNARQRKEAVDALERQARHDTLTGLPNRSLFFARLHAALRRTERRPTDRVAVVFCDIDGFKDVNDRLGHQVGDRLLQTVADRMRPLVRAGDTLARLAGDEFTLVCEDVQRVQEVLAIGHRIVAAVAAPLPVEGEQIQLTISVGVAITDGGDDGETLLAKADQAMYTAKQRGRNQVAVADESLLLKPTG